MPNDRHLADQAVTLPAKPPISICILGDGFVDRLSDGQHQVTLGGGLALGNKGDTLILSDADGATIDTVTYTVGHVHPGRSVCFGRT